MTKTKKSFDPNGMRPTVGVGKEEQLWKGEREGDQSSSAFPPVGGGQCAPHSLRPVRFRRAIRGKMAGDGWVSTGASAKVRRGVKCRHSDRRPMRELWNQSLSVCFSFYSVCLSVLAPEEVSGYEITHLPRWKNKTLLLSNTKLIEHWNVLLYEAKPLS